ncbi:MAG: phospho-sugar mutase, partial [Bacilli bacterium]
QSLYQRYGYHYEEVRSLALPGLDGLTRLHTMMKTLRQARFTTLGALAVVRREDYQTLRYELANGQEGELDFPASDVLRYELEDGSVLAIRPSGTEPKCKFYYNLVGQSLEDAKTKLQRIADSIAPYIQ